MSREIKAVCVVAKPPRDNPQSGGVLVPVRFRYKVRDYTKGCEYHATDRGTERVLVSGGLVPVIYPLRPGNVFGVAGVETLVVWKRWWCGKTQRSGGAAFLLFTRLRSCSVTASGTV